MMRKVLTSYTYQLDEYLMRIHHRPEGLAVVSQIVGTTEELPNKVVVSLLSLERETAGGITSSAHLSNNGGYTKTQPPLLLNMNVMIASVFDSRRYLESLSVLSDTLLFVQTSPRFVVDGVTYTIEVVNTSAQDLNNVWTLLGGQYYPSVVCKIRHLVIDGAEIMVSGRLANNPKVETKV